MFYQSIFNLRYAHRYPTLFRRYHNSVRVSAQRNNLVEAPVGATPDLVSLRLSKQLRKSSLRALRKFLRISISIAKMDKQCGEYIQWRALDRFRRHQHVTSFDRRIKLIKVAQYNLRMLQRVVRLDSKAFCRLLSLAYGLRGRFHHILIAQMSRTQNNLQADVVANKFVDANLLPPTMIRQIHFCTRLAAGRSQFAVATKCKSKANHQCGSSIAISHTLVLDSYIEEFFVRQDSHDEKLSSDFAWRRKMKSNLALSLNL